MEDAVLKAFTEVWQTSLLLIQTPFFEAQDYGGDRLKEDFKSANRPDFDLGVGVDPVCIGKEFTCGDDILTLIHNLNDISENIYRYEKELMVNGVKLNFCRIASPDFFIHMSPGESNNNNNKWIRYFCKPADMRIEALPFS